MPRSYLQLALFTAPRPVKLTHDWLVRPVGPNECGRCFTLWFSGADRGDTVAFLTETCPAKTDGAARPAYVYLS